MCTACMLCVCVCMPHVLQDRARRSLQETLNAIKCQEFGVYVQAPTLGSLEALVEFLNQSKIPVRAEGQHGGCTGSGFVFTPLLCSFYSTLVPPPLPNSPGPLVTLLTTVPLVVGARNALMLIVCLCMYTRVFVLVIL